MKIPFSNTVKVVSEKTNTSQKIVRIILNAYISICIKEILSGYLIIFPSNFGSVEIITRPWNERTLRFCIEKYGSDNVNFDYQTKTDFTLNYNQNYKMSILGFSKLALLLKYSIRNKLKKYRYVDK